MDSSLLFTRWTLLMALIDIVVKYALVDTIFILELNEFYFFRNKKM